MKTQEEMLKCKSCGRKTVHLKKVPSSLLHLVLTILTAGLWAIVWIGVSLNTGKPTCKMCGKTRGAFGLW